MTCSYLCQYLLIIMKTSSFVIINGSRRDGFFFHKYGQQLSQLSFISEDWFNKNCNVLYLLADFILNLCYLQFCEITSIYSLLVIRSVSLEQGQECVSNPLPCQLSFFFLNHVNVHLSLEWIYRGYFSSPISPVNNISAQNHKSSSEVNRDQSHSEAIMENSYEEEVEILKGIGGKWS